MRMFVGLLWLLMALVCAFVALDTFFFIATAREASAPQLAAFAALKILYLMIPYTLARAFEGMARPWPQQIDMSSIVDAIKERSTSVAAIASATPDMAAAARQEVPATLTSKELIAKLQAYGWSVESTGEQSWKLTSPDRQTSLEAKTAEALLNMARAIASRRPAASS